jgi:hypothetical protein
MTPVGALIVIASVTALVLIDARVVGEDVLVENLGVSRIKTALHSMQTALPTATRPERARCRSCPHGPRNPSALRRGG